MAIQAKLLKIKFPDSQISCTPNSITWKGKLIPSPMSDEYEIKICLNKGKSPKIYVIDPILEEPKNKKLPHVYPDNDLCLYYPDGKEWNEEKFLVDTIIPWTSEWLFHYELWLSSGKWNGGGVHPQVNKVIDES